MARRQSASCNFCAMAQAMLLLLARPKMTALFCESLTNSSAEKVISSQSSVLSKTGKPRRVYQPRRTHRHSFTPLVARPLLKSDEMLARFPSRNIAALLDGHADSSSDSRSWQVLRAAIPSWFDRVAYLF